MNLARAQERASTVTGPKSAARLYNDIEHELELGGGGSEDSYEQGEQALHTLEQRFPDVRDQARQITTPPSVSRRAKTHMYQRGDQHRPAGAAIPRRQHQRETSRPNRTARQRVASATAIHAHPRRGGGGGDGRRWAQTGIPTAGESATQLLMRTLGIIAGLSFVYVLLQPNGTRAISATSSGLTHALAALFSPSVDPLRASRKQQAIYRSNATTPIGGVGPSVTRSAGQLGASIAAIGNQVGKTKAGTR